ncbi:FkbM family methyltransferase [Putridiphycobacter roseus]|nr:FkbM family methyltransferase [Putridiphycobacter roseus]
MKNRIKYILQKILGYHTYLYWFSLFKIKTLKGDKKEGDFFYFMNSIDQAGDLLDIGANIGIMTYHLSKHFPDRKIYAIEPMPDNLAILEKVVAHKKLKNVNILPLAVGHEATNLEMVLPLERNVKMQGLAHVVHDSIAEWNEGEKFNVKCITLDQEFENVRIAGIKMDIENFEYFALLGGQKMIQKYKPVIYLELWPNEGRDKCFDLLNKLGYKAFVVIESKLIKFNPAIHEKQNFVFKV